MSEVETPQISQIELLASGLDSPRKLSFGPDRALHNGPRGSEGVTKCH